MKFMTYQALLVSTPSPELAGLAAAAGLASAAFADARVLRDDLSSADIAMYITKRELRPRQVGAIVLSSVRVST